jgi:DNA repair protein SbcC/Rad50
MIKKLQIRNFQSHQKTLLEFDPGVNIIVGSSDSGKTAIIRALRWVVWNRPSGEAFRSFWGEETKVSINMNSEIVKRTKSKYTYIDSDSKFNFEAFKTDVPKEISNALNITNINLQSQLDAPFLLSNTAGEVASHFNKVARLDTIDTATANVNSWIRELEQSIKRGKADEEKLTEQLKSFKYLTKMEVEVEVLEEMEKRRVSKDINYRQLHGIIRQISETEAEIEGESEILELKPLVDQVLNKIEKQDDLKVQEKKLYKILDSLDVIEFDLDDLNKLTKLTKPVEIVLALYEKRTTLNTGQISLNKLLSAISSNNTLLLKIKANLAVEIKTFNKEMGDTCLLCGQPLKINKYEKKRN